MEVNEKDILLIENYLDGTLEAEAIIAFDERIKTDENFARALESRKAMPGLLQKASDYKVVREEVKLELDQYNPKKTQINKVMVYSIAASVILLAGIFIVLKFTVFSPNDSSTIMAESVDSTEQLSKMDEPVEYGNKAIRNVGILLVSPIDDKVIPKANHMTFVWTTKRTDSAMLIIFENERKSILIEQMVLLSNKKLEIRDLDLRTGGYSWYIDHKITVASFYVE